MKKSKVLLSVVLIMSLVFAMAACGGGSDDSPEKAFKGSWVSEATEDSIETTFTFDGKGKCSFENEYGIKGEGTYTVDGSDLTIEMDLWDAPHEYSYEIDDTTLTLDNYDDYKPSYVLTKI